MPVWSEIVDYRHYQKPYLKRFFSGVAKAIPLTGQEDLLDLGCGGGEVALGFAPFVASLTGIDIEQPMLEAAAKEAAAAGRKIRLIHSKVEEAPEKLGPFHLITMGRSYWFMHTPAVLARLDGWLRPGGRVLICWPRLNADGAEWQNLYQAIRLKWVRGNLRPLMALTVEQFFEGTNFVAEKRVVARGQTKLELEHLINRTLGIPGTTRATLGAEDTDRMIAEIRGAMAPYFRDGPILENQITLGFLYRRKQDS